MNAKGTPKSILIVDDHPITREGLVALIEREKDLEIHGQADTAREAMTLLEASVPDLVLLDLNLPDKDGLELLKDIRALHPDLPVLVLSMHDEAMYATRVLRAGGNGYIAKREGGVKLLAAIRKVLSGEFAVSEKMVSVVLESLSNHKRNSGSGPEGKLTDRELEVLRMYGEGWSKEEIAKRLRISPKTVEAHRTKVKEKLGLQNQPEFLRFAIRWVNSETRSTDCEPTTG